MAAVPDLCYTILAETTIALYCILVGTFQYLELKLKYL